VSANVFVEKETGRVLIDLMMLGVSSWILCRSRFAYLLFMRDFLSELVDLKREDAGDLREAGEGFLEETRDVLGEAGYWFSAQRRKPSAGKRGRRPVRPQSGYVEAPSSRSAMDAT